jgi:hypothetical protein
MEKQAKKDYTRYRPFDRGAFTNAYLTEFRSVPKFNVASVHELVELLGMMEADPAITDIRWMAYMLATAFIETSNTVKITRAGKDKHGRSVTRIVKVWRNFAPVEEIGHGRKTRYGKPVKVKSLPDGSARVTEYDGEQWTVSQDGHTRAQGRGQGLGTDVDSGAADAYTEDDGAEEYYYGRAFVQLSWSNYATTGVFVGRGLDLLFEPDLVCQPNLAYQIMSTGMRTGAGFANRRTFSRYFNDNLTDYANARAMVNGNSHEHEIAKIAERFEKVLFAAAGDAAVTASQ